jgi:tryptophan synthase alpha chain
VSRLTQRFQQLKDNGEKALVCYIMAGDPTLDATVEIALALDAAGADAIELGVPFSDPLADGPSIQAAAQRALGHGATVTGTLEVVAGIRRTSQIPIVLMTYFNPTLRYGVERFAKEVAGAGADGVIQTDLTPEEAGDWMGYAREAGLDTIFLLAPTSTPDRIDVVTKISSGFVYCVSRTGVTGAREDIPEELRAFVGRVKEKATAPVCVGFGISKPEHVTRIGAFSDGVVVGSALVEVIARYGDSPDLAREVQSFASQLKAATRPSVVS